MKIAYINDIHLDFYIKCTNPQNKKLSNEISKFITDILRPPPANILIIAGDLGHVPLQDRELLLQLREVYNHILLVEGNHSRYLLSKTEQKKYQYNSQEKVNEMQYWCNSQDNIHYLDGNTVVIDGISFAGLGMGWDGSYATKHYKYSLGTQLEEYHNVMNDSNLIFGGSKNYDVPTAYGGVHKIRSFDPIGFFKGEYEKLQKIEYCDVMITHYPPFISKVLPPRFDVSSTTFYVFDGDSELERLKPKMWMSGHQHFKFDEEYKGCRMLNNPLGYPNELVYSGISLVEI